MATIDQPDGHTLTLGYEGWPRRSKIGRLVERNWHRTPNREGPATGACRRNRAGL